MNDLITPVLPFVGDRVGKNGTGRPMVALDWMVVSISTPRTRRRDWLREVGLILNRRSTPFVWLFATQLFAQLEKKPCNANFTSQDKVDSKKTY